MRHPCLENGDSRIAIALELQEALIAVRLDCNEALIAVAFQCGENIAMLLSLLGEVHFALRAPCRQSSCVLYLARFGRASRLFASSCKRIFVHAIARRQRGLGFRPYLRFLVGFVAPLLRASLLITTSLLEVVYAGSFCLGESERMLFAERAESSLLPSFRLLYFFRANIELAHARLQLALRAAKARLEVFRRFLCLVLVCLKDVHPPLLGREARFRRTQTSLRIGLRSIEVERPILDFYDFLVALGKCLSQRENFLVLLVEPFSQLQKFAARYRATDSLRCREELRPSFVERSLEARRFGRRLLLALRCLALDFRSSLFCHAQLGADLIQLCLELFELGTLSNRGYGRRRARSRNGGGVALRLVGSDGGLTGGASYI